MLKKSILLLVLLFNLGFSNISFADVTFDSSGKFTCEGGTCNEDDIKTINAYKYNIEGEKKADIVAAEMDREEIRDEQQDILDNKSSTNKERAIAVKIKDDNSEVNAAKNKAIKEEGVAKGKVKIEKVKNKALAKEIETLTEEKKDVNNSYISEDEKKKKLDIINKSLETNSENKKKSDKNLELAKTALTAKSEKVDDSKKAVHDAGGSKIITEANNAVIEEAGKTIVSTEGKSGKDLSDALKKNLEASNTMKAFAAKNEKEARVNFNNSENGRKLQKSVDDAQEKLNTAVGKEAKEKAQNELSKAKSDQNDAENKNDAVVGAKSASESISEFTTEAREKFCDDSEGCIEKTSFIINVNDISPGLKVKKDSTINENINFVLGTIIQKLMIALGSFALLIMTVGAGYIVLHNGQDELLNKGKAIFMSGVYSLVVALGSYYIIAIVRYILYF